MDRVEKIGSSTVQHGEDNSRVYIMKLKQEDMELVLEESLRLGERNGYGKIIAKIPESMGGKFSTNGFNLEAVIDGFYGGEENGLFMSKFLSEERMEKRDENELEEVIDIAKSKKDSNKDHQLDPKYQIRKCEKEDSKEMAKLYKKVFATYPFPIFERDYIEQTMDENVCYYGIWHKKKLVALSSSEMDLESKNTEMTDFATDPEHRGQSLSQFLLKAMERDMSELGIKTAYTIARAKITGINVIFAKADYIYSGTLVNNTNIDGSIESMNIWYKSL